MNYFAPFNEMGVSEVKEEKDFDVILKSLQFCFKIWEKTGRIKNRTVIFRNFRRRRTKKEFTGFCLQVRNRDKSCESNSEVNHG